MVLACKQSCKGMSCHVKEVHWKSENICGLEQLVPQTPIWQFGKVWYYVSLKKIVWYYTSLRVWYYMSLTKSVWYSASLRKYDTICMILCALPSYATQNKKYIMAGLVIGLDKEPKQLSSKPYVSFIIVDFPV